MLFTLYAAILTLTSFNTRSTAPGVQLQTESISVLGSVNPNFLNTLLFNVFQL